MIALDHFGLLARTWFVFGLALSPACDGTDARELASKAPNSSRQVAFLLATLQEERYQKDQKYFEDKARSLGLSPFTLSADNDSARQLSQVEDALARGARVLVIQPTDTASAVSYVKKARAAGAKVIAYDRSIAGADAWVAHDSFRVGRLQAREALKATDGKGNYVLLNGQSGSTVAEAIARGYRETLSSAVKSGRITIVVEKSHSAWSPAQALETVEDALTKARGDIDAILANNSGLARGAVQAIIAASPDGDTFIAGADADAANVNYVCEGKQSVEVMKDIRDLAQSAATLAFRLAQGKKITAERKWSGIPAFPSPVRLIHRDNVTEALIESGFHDAAMVSSCIESNP